MNKKNKSLLWLFPYLSLLALGFMMLWPLSAKATIMTFELGMEFSGGTPPEGTAPWITATFDDSFGGVDTVRLTMAADNLTDNEFISGWYFNFDPDLDLNQLGFSYISGGVAESNITINTGVNSFQADGDGLYDILFDFPPPPGQPGNRFTAGDTVVYDITYTSAIDVSSFNFFSAPAGGHGPFVTAAHIQGIGPDDEDSGWVSVPDASIMFLLGPSLIGLGILGRRKKRK